MDHVLWKKLKYKKHIIGAESLTFNGHVINHLLGELYFIFLIAKLNGMIYNEVKAF